MAKLINPDNIRNTLAEYLIECGYKAKSHISFFKANRDNIAIICDNNSLHIYERMSDQHFKIKCSIIGTEKYNLLEFMLQLHLFGAISYDEMKRVFPLAEILKPAA